MSDNVHSDIRTAALLLASPELDGSALEAKYVGDAMSLARNDDAREELANSLAMEALKTCSSDGGYERTCGLLLSALVLEINQKEWSTVAQRLTAAVASLIEKSWEDGVEVDIAQNATEFLVGALGESALGPAAALCSALDIIGTTLLRIRSKGMEGSDWSGLAERTAIPAVSALVDSVPTATAALEVWKRVAGTPSEAAAAVAPANVTDREASDATAKAKPSTGERATVPGAQVVGGGGDVSELDRRIQTKMTGSNGAGGAPSPPSVSAPAASDENAQYGAGSGEHEDPDASLKAKIKAEMGRAPVNSPDDLDERIKSKTGAHPVSTVDRSSPKTNSGPAGNNEKSDVLVSTPSNPNGPNGASDKDERGGFHDPSDVSDKPQGGMERAPPQRNDNGTSQGGVNEPDFGQRPESAMGGGDSGFDNGFAYVAGEDVGEDGLAVAVAVSPDEDEAFIPSAIEFDPDSKPALYRNRRFRIYGIAAIAVLIVAVVAVAVGVTQTLSDGDTTEILVTPAPTPVPSASPTTVREGLGLYDILRDIAGNKVYDLSTPQGRAARWILRVDPLQLSVDSPNLVQRFVLAVIFFSTAWENDPLSWIYCSPPVPFLKPHNYTDCDYIRVRRDLSRVVVNSTTWLAGTHECEWMGIYCSPADMEVREIRIFHNNMTGTIPPEVSRIRYLRNLRLIDNKLHGTIPSELGTMRHLEMFEVNANFLTGKIPDELYNIKTMGTLNLGDNLLSGTISTRIGELQNMLGFFTFYNEITGTVPTEVGSLKNLLNIRMNDNVHTGQMPSELGQLSKLREFYFQRNALNGTLPSELGGLSKVREIYINGNKITGTLPPEIFSLTTCSYFYFYDNAFTGTLPPHVGNMTGLLRLVARRNQLAGNIPSEFSKLKNLQMLWLHFNRLSGSVPIPICNLRMDGALFSLSVDCSTDNATSNEGVRCACCTQCCNAANEICLRQEA